MLKRISLAVSSLVLLLMIAFPLRSTYVYAGSTIFAKAEYSIDSENSICSIDFQAGVRVSAVTSSNKDVVEVDDIQNSYVYLEVVGVGTATLTATDTNGNTDTCTVVVTPPEFVLSDSEVSFSDYALDDDDYRFVRTESNYIKSVSSSNTAVAKVYLSAKYEFYIRPVSAGTAVITAKDVYGQTKTVNVEVTQKYIDEKTYLPIMEDAYDFATGLRFGSKELELSSSSSLLKKIDIQVQIDGVSYNGKRGYSYSEYTYTISKIPALKVGAKVHFAFSAGEASYEAETTIDRADLTEDAWLMFGTGNDYDYSYSHVYTGKQIKPAIVLSDLYDRNLVKERDYKVTYTNNTDVGVAKVTVKGIGNYKGTLTKTFRILPKSTTINKLVAGKKSITVKWKKQAAKMAKTRITGYQIRYSTKSNMSGAKTIKVKGYSKVSAKLSKLKSNKKYYVQIRTYTTINKKDYFGKWSPKKSIRVK